MKKGMKMEPKKADKRLHLIDEYRGLLVINMIAYHAIWDFVHIYGNEWKWFKTDIEEIWQQWICWSFIFVSGFCWKMSKNNLKRGILVFLCGGVITVITLMFMPDSAVIFGVLTFLGSAMILLIPLDLVFKKIKPIPGIIGSLFLFLITFHMKSGYLGLGNIRLVTLPQSWYANYVTTYLGCPESGFYSSDYLPLVPWLFLFVTGYFFYGLVSNKEKRIQKILEKSIFKPFGWVGRHALVIYILHQPIVYGVLYLIDVVWSA